jgi:hypothetical protein
MHHTTASALGAQKFPWLQRQGRASEWSPTQTPSARNGVRYRRPGPRMLRERTQGTVIRSVMSAFTLNDIATWRAR